jgi:hypothetical protein
MKTISNLGKKVYFILFLIYIPIIGLAQSNKWMETFDGLISSAVFQSSDKSIYIYGTHKTNPITTDCDVSVIKCDSTGKLLWRKIFNLNAEDITGKGQMCEINNTLYLCGNTRLSNTDPWDIFAIKLNSTGNILATKVFGGPLSDPITGGVNASADKTSIYISGTTLSGTFGANDFFYVNLDLSLNIIQGLHSGSFSGETDGNLNILSNGDIVIGGMSNIGVEPWNGNVVYINKNNNQVWSKYIIGCRYGFLETYDDAIVSVGDANSSISIVKISKSGAVLLAKNLATGSSGARIIKTNDNGFAVLGNTSDYSQDGTKYDIILIKLDSNLRIEWSKVYGLPNNDEYCQDIYQKSDGGYMIGGSCSNTKWTGNVLTDQVIISTDNLGNTCQNFSPVNLPIPQSFVPATGNSGTTGSLTFSSLSGSFVTSTFSGKGTLCNLTGIKENSREETINIYPNPASTILHLDLTNPEKYEVTITGITGQTTIINSTSGGIDISGFENGVYFLTICDKNNNFMSTNKVVIIK